MYIFINFVYLKYNQEINKLLLCTLECIARCTLRYTPRCVSYNQQEVLDYIWNNSNSWNCIPLLFLFLFYIYNILTIFWISRYSLISLFVLATIVTGCYWRNILKMFYVGHDSIEKCFLVLHIKFMGRCRRKCLS